MFALIAINEIDLTTLRGEKQVTETGSELNEYKLNKNNVQLKVGSTLSLEISEITGKIENPDERAWQWKSSNSDVASVSNGVVTGLSAGTTTIYAQDTYGHRLSAIINVYANHSNAITKAKMAEGDTFTIALKDDGTVYTWGNNNNGQLGKGTAENVNYDTPVQVKINETDYLTNIIDVVAGPNYSVALSSDGSVWTWGLNNYNQLGDGTATQRAYPVQVKISEEEYLTGIVDLAAGELSTVALKEDGTVYTWGYNGNGELGRTGDNKYAAKADNFENIIKVEAGYRKTVALRADGTVWTCGYNGWGEFGNGTTAGNQTPQQANITNVVDIAVAYHNVMYLKDDATAWITGYNGYGQLAQGGTSQSYTPVQMKYAENSNITNVKYISGGQWTTYVTTKDNKVYSAGLGTSGQIGNNAAVNTVYLTEVTDLSGKKVNELGVTIDSIMTSSMYADTGYIIATDGSVYGWGYNAHGQLQMPTYIGSYNYLSRVGNLDEKIEYITLARGETKKLNLTEEDLKVGYNLYSPNNSATISYELTDTSIATVNSNGLVTAVKEGRTSGKIKSSTGYEIEFIVEVKENIAKVIGGETYSLALKEDGTVWSWGNNEYGQLGINSTTATYKESQVLKYTYDENGTINGTEPLTDIKDVAAGGYFVLALANDGSVYGWGYNGNGELGDGTTGNKWCAVKVKTTATEYITGVSKIAAGNNHSVYLKEDGSVYTSGYNYYGQLGRGDSQVYAMKTSRANFEGVVDIGAGSYNTVALKKDGTVWTCGHGGYGQLGDGTTGNVQESKQAKFEDGTILTGIKDIAVGFSQTIALGNNGNVYTWGLNNLGDLGIGNNTNQVYVQNTGVSAIKIGAARQTSIIQKADKTIWATGLGDNGQIGNYKNLNVNTFTQVLESDGKAFKSDLNYIVESSSIYNVYTVSVDGSVYGWGYNGRYCLQKASNIANFNYSTRVGESGEKIKLVRLIKGETSKIEISPEDLIEGYNIYNHNMENIKYTYSLENPEIATIDSKGIVTGVSEGTAKGTITSSNGFSIEIAVVVEKNVAKVVNGENFSVALKEDGTVWTWGYQGEGRLGNGISANSNIIDPTEVKQGKYEEYVTDEETGATDTRFVEDKSLTDVIDISAGQNYVIALKRDGTVWTWGYNGNGRLGDGTTTERRYATQVKVDESTYLTDIVDISAGTENTVALRTDGTVWTWGYNDYGQLGRSGNNIPYAGKADVFEKIIKVEAGYRRTVGLKIDGTVWSCGYNGNGEFGDGTTTTTQTAQKSKIEDVVDISTTWNTTTYLKKDGTVWASGWNGYGQLGNGTTGSSTVPVQMQYLVEKEVEQEDGNKTTVTEGVNIDNAKYIGGGIHTTYVVTKDNKVYGTGLGTSGEIGNLASANKVYLTEIKDIDGKTVQELGIEVDKIVGSSIYGNTGYIIASDGSVYGWGLNNYAQLQKVTTIGTYNYLVRLGQIGEKIKVVHIIENEQKDLNIKDTDLMAGFNIYNHNDASLKYELNNEKDNVVATVNEEGIVTGVSEGTAKGTITSSNGFSIEIAVVVEKNVAKVVNGENFSVALKEDGTVWTWGYQGEGRLGNGISANSNIIDPTEVKQGKYEEYVTDEETGATDTRFVEDKSLTDVIDISAGQNYVIALKRDGTVWTWGYNGNGRLGDGTTTERRYATQVKVDESTYLTDIVDISAGTENTVALRTDGTVWTWGYNDYGQLGRSGNNIPYAGKADVFEKIIKVEAGYRRTVGLKIDGTVWSCGYNGNGEFGDGTTTTTQTAQKSKIEDVVDISTTWNTTTYLKKDGTVWASGWNGYGQLGNGTTGSSTVPVQMQYLVEKEVEQEDGNKTTVTEGVNIDNAKYIGGGIHTTYVVTKDNKVYGTGLGTSGEIGNLASANKVYLTEIKDIDGKTVQELGIEVDKIVGSSIYGNTGYIIASDGSVYGWGLNNYAQLQKVTTIGTYNYLVRLGQIGEKIKVVKMNVGEEKALNLKTENIISGFNVYTHKDSPLKYEYKLADETSENSIATITEEGILTANKVGTTILTVKDETNNLSMDIYVEIEKNVAKVVSGENFTVALKSDGTVWTWGYNGYGQLGIGRTYGRNDLNQQQVLKGKYEEYVVNEETGETATRLVEDGYLTDVIDISAGQNFAVAVTKDGKAYAWGLNDYGQLAQGNTTNYTYAMQMKQNANTYIEGVVSASTSQISTSLLKEDGSVYTCGYNGEGQLGRTGENRYLSLATGMEKTVKLSSGYRSVSALNISGKVYSVGYNGYGQFGNEATSGGISFRVESKIDEVKDIASMQNTNIFLLNDGTISTVGLGTTGQLGTGENKNSLTATKVVIDNPEYVPEKTVVNEETGEETVIEAVGEKYLVLNNVIKIGAIQNTGYALVKNEENYSLYAWGIGTSGQLGNNANNNSNVATKVQDMQKEDLQVVIDKLINSPYSNTGYSIREDGVVYAWGNNGNGQIVDYTDVTSYNYAKTIGEEYLELSEKQKILKPEEKINITAKVTTEFNIYCQKTEVGELTYTSNDEEVASIDEKGNIVGKKLGKTLVNVKDSKTGNTASVAIFVTSSNDGAITVPQVEQGENFTVVLKEDGTVWTSGYNGNGQLGDGTYTNRTSAVQVKLGKYEDVTDETTGTVSNVLVEDGYLENVVKISAGQNFALAVTKDGKVYSWGYNDYGKLGLGDGTTRAYAMQVKNAEGTGYFENAIDVSAGDLTTIILDKDGQTWGIGHNAHGQFGDSTTINSSLPVKSTLKNVIKVSEDYSSTVVLKATGESYTVGHNYQGELGMGTSGDVAAHIRPYNIMNNVVDVQKGRYFTLVQTKDGKVYGAGQNTSGQLGDGTYTNALSLVEMILDVETGEIENQIDTEGNETQVNKTRKLDIGEISVSGHTTYIKEKDGTVWATGYNGYGQLAQGNTTNTNKLQQMKINVSTNMESALFLGRSTSGTNIGLIDTTGGVYVAGSNAYGQYADTSTASVKYLTKFGTGFIELNKKNELIHIGDTLNAKVLNYDFDFNVFNKEQKADFTWKSYNEDIATVDENGNIVGKEVGYTTIIATEENTKMISEIRVQVTEENRVAMPQVGQGESFTATLKADGTVWTVGLNNRGQLGNGTTIDSIDPVQVKISDTTYLTNVVKISVGYAHTLALTANGDLYAWGFNNWGQLGQNNTANLTYAKKVMAPNGQAGYIENVIDIATGMEFSAAVTNTGDLYAWGYNGYGQFGTGNANASYLPVRTGMTNVISVAQGEYHTLVLRIDGSVWGTGRNTEGQLGIGNTSTTYTFQKVTGNVVEIAANGYSSAILTKDRKVYTFGYNNVGQLGLGDTDVRNLPTEVSLDIKEISEEIVKNEETGEEETVEVEKVLKTVNPKYISMGFSHVMILDGNEDKAYITGSNSNGQLSQGDNVNRSEFISMKNSSGEDFEDVLLLAEGSDVWYTAGNCYNSGVIGKDGYVYIAGYNGYGQIGNSSKTDSKYLTRMGNSFLDTSDKIVNLKPEETKQLTKDGFKYVGAFNVFEGEEKGVGELSFEIANEEIATVDNTGLISAVKNGITKVIATDTSTGMNTNIFVKVSSGEEPVIDAGNRFTVGVKTNGTVWTYGENYYGNLGIGNNTYFTEPQQVIGGKIYTETTTVTKEEVEKTQTNPETGEQEIVKEEVEKSETVTTEEVEAEYLENIVEVRTGYHHAVALTKDGDVYTWGYNGHGELGTGNTTWENRPVKITDKKLVTKKDGVTTEEKAIDLGKVIKVDAWQYMTTVLNEAGEVYVWGYGYGANPVKLSFDKKVIDISGKLLLTEDRKVYTMDNLRSQIIGLNNILKISAGTDHNLALASDGTVYSWGYNSYGQLGNATNAHSVNTPVKVLNPEGTEVMGDIFDISAGQYYSVISDVEGNVYTFGHNGNYRLGQGSINVNKPIQVENLSNIELIAASEGGHTAVSNYDGFMYTVGLNDAGQLGLKDYVQRSEFEQVGDTIVESDPSIVKLKVGENKDLQVTLNNTFNLKIDVADKENIEMQVIDKNILQLNNKTATGIRTGKTIIIARHIPTGKIRYIQVDVTQGEEYVASKIANGNDFTVALRADGNVWIWGTNANGTLGRNDVSYSNVPAKVNLNEEKIEDIAVGDNHVLVLTEEGKVYSWGYNGYGQLGRGGAGNLPYKVVDQNGKELEGIVKVKAGKNVSYAIDSFGKVYAWGQGYYGNARVINGIEQEIIDISKSFMVDSQGKMYMYGVTTTSGILTIGNVQKIAGTNKAISVSEGYDHAAFVTDAGTIYSIGNNSFGQLGDGTTKSTTNKVVEVCLSETIPLYGVVDVYAGDRYTVALTSSGELYTWGMNTNKEQGIEDQVIVRNPELSTKISGLIGVTAGYGTTTVVKEDGTVWGMGQGKLGQLGNREEIDSVNPVMAGEYFVKTNTNRVEIPVGESINLSAYVEYFNMLYSDAKEITFTSKDTSVAYLGDLKQEEKESLDEHEFGKKLTAARVGTTTVVVSQNNSENIGIIQVEAITENTNIKPQVATGDSHTLMLKTDGTVWAYGNNSYGQLGINSTTNVDEPTQVIFPEGTKIVQVAVGDNHSVALDSNGNVWTWGRNNYYQLGLWGWGDLSTPYKIGYPGSKVVKIATGSNLTVMLTANGEVYTHGINADGEAGNGSYDTRVTYAKANNINNIIDIAVGKSHVMLLRSDGTIYTTGSNLYGQLGIGTKNTTKTNEYKKLEIKNVAYIEAEENSSSALTADGRVYVWGSNVYGQLGTNDKEERIQPSMVKNIANIREISMGKTHTVVRDGNGTIYAVGYNTEGQHGTGDTNNRTQYTRIGTIENLIDISAGNTYTVALKSNGKVYAWGDYNHGEIGKRSKTNSEYPVLVGNEESTINTEEIIVNKNGTASIIGNAKYEFNLIKITKQDSSIFTYESLNEEKAIINEKGIITGKEVGTTWVKAINKDTGTESIAIVRVIEEGSTVAPKIEGGDDYAIVQKADGTIWSFGYNSDGQLGIGTKNSSLIPIQSNIIATYKDISVGNNFTLALRQDGTVWCFGDNTYGQLGIKGIENSSKLIQIEGLEDIVAISAGENYGIALDRFGILYGWGENSEGQLGKENIGKKTNTPVQINADAGNIISIDAGENQTAVVNAKGEIYGYGSLFAGKLENIENAFKVKVGKDYILALKKDNTVEKYYIRKVEEQVEKQEYVNGELVTYYETVIKYIPTVEIMCLQANVIDIDIKENENMYQTVDGQVYTWGENSKGQLGLGNTEDVTFPRKVETHGDNVFRIGAGYYNTYIIANTGSVYGAGKNNYGQLGNGTNDASTEYTLVGDRNFEIVPQNKLLTINDIEDVEIESNTFNVFSVAYKDFNEYEWKSTDENVVYYEDGTFVAKGVGEATITATDKLTGQEKTALRVVQPVNTDRMKVLTVDGVEAQISGVQQYTVKIPENGNTGRLNIVTKRSTDLISIDGGENWYTKEVLSTIDLPNDITELPIKIKVTNGTIVDYLLIIDKLSNENGLENLTVDGENVDKLNSTTFEIVVAGEKEEVTIEGTAVDEKADITVDGIAKTKHISTAITKLNGNKKEVQIQVISESGRTNTYTLIIYKEVEENTLNITKVKVNNTEATKVNSKEFYIEIGNDVTTAKIDAESLLKNTQIKIAESEYADAIATHTVEVSENITEIIITAKYKEETKEYKLTIAKQAVVEQMKQKHLSLESVKVNGTETNKVSDTLYYVEMGSAVEEVTIEVLSNYGEIRIENSQYVEFTNSIEKQLEDKTTDVKIYVRYGTEEKTYTLRIAKRSEASLRCNLDNVIVNGTTASKIDGESYYIEVEKDTNLIEIEAIANGKNVKIEAGEYLENTAKAEYEFSTDRRKYSITVQNGEEEQEYTLTVVRRVNETDGNATDSSNETTITKECKLDSVTVNGETANKINTSTYYIEVSEDVNSLEIMATAMEKQIKIGNETYKNNSITITDEFTEDSKVYNIDVKNGNYNYRYKLKVVKISKAAQECSLNKVTVNNIAANKIDAKTYYIEVSSNTSAVDIKAIAEGKQVKIGTLDFTTDVSNITDTFTENSKEYAITVQNGEYSYGYVLKVVRKAEALDPLKINLAILDLLVDGKEATFITDEENTYKFTLDTAKKTISVYAKADRETTNVSVNNGEYSLNSRTEEVEVISSNMVIPIVLAEENTVKTYYLRIEGLPDETGLDKVTVNGIEANYNYETGRYEAKADRELTTYKLEVKAQDQLATLATGENTNKGNISTSVTKQGEETIVELKVIAQNEVTERTYQVAIIEKSNDASINKVTVNGIEANINDAGNYEVKIDDVNSIGNVQVVPNDTNATVTIAGETVNPKDIELTNKFTEVALKVTAEDGSIINRILTIEKVSSDKAIEVYAGGEKVTKDSRGIYYHRISRRDEIELKIIANSVAKISINGGDYILSENTVTISTTEEITNAEVKVLAEDGTEQIYTVQLEKKGTNINIKEITSGESMTAEVVDNTTYEMIISDKLKELDITAVTEDERASIRISNSENASKNIQKQTIDIENVDSFIVEVIAEDGETTRQYTVNLIKVHSIDVINVLVNDVEATRSKDTYASVVEDYNTTDVTILADNDDIPIKLIKDGYTIAEGIGRIDTKIERTKRIEDYIIISTSADGSRQREYSFSIRKRLSRNVSITVDEETPVKQEENVYRQFIERDTNTVHVKLVAEEQTALIRSKEINDETGNKLESIQTLEFDVPITEEKTNLTFEIEVQDDETREITVQIWKYSDDNTLEYIKVNNQTAYLDAEGNYRVQLLDNTEYGDVQVKSNNEFAYVRINDNPEAMNYVTGRQYFENVRETYIPILVRSQIGETEVYNLVVERISTNLELESILVDDKEAVYNAEAGIYVATVETDISKHEVFIMAKDQYTKLEYEGETGVGTVRQTVYLLNVEGYQETTINVSSESGGTTQKKLVIANKSDDAKLNNLWVNDMKLEPIDEDGLIYAADIKKLAGTAKISVETHHPYASIRIGDFAEGIGKTTKNITLPQDSETITVPVLVTATDGVTVATYNVILTRLSNNTNITKVEINGKEIVSDEEGNYEITMTADEELCNVLVMAEDKKAKISIGKETYIGTLEEDADIDVTAKESERTIKIVAQDGTVRESKLKIKWLGRFTGTVKTQAVEGVAQKAWVVIYNVEDTGKEIGIKDIISGEELPNIDEEGNLIEWRKISEKVETQEDGSFAVNLYPGEYEMVILKESYLKYRKVNLSVDGGEIIDIGEQKILAGDVNGDGQIEISDLTAVTSNTGEVTEETRIYDLNEDGKVDKEDRNILRGNYTRKDIREEWVMPRAVLRNRLIRRKEGDIGEEEYVGDDLAIYIKTNEIFLFPLSVGEGESYRITSPYGTRIHPTTGVESKHTGIDIQAKWHTQIYSVAEGEVVFAGNNGAFGNSVEIKHVINGKEIYTFYAHLSKINVKVGEKVTRGQVIGLEGGDASDENPGTSTGHHLHFEVRTASGYGNDVDPNYYINF